MSVSTNLGVKDAAMTRLQEPVEDLSPEKDGEAATLVADVRKAAKNLDAKNLEPSALGALDHTVARLAVIAKEREDRREASERLRSRFEDWRAAHSKALADTAEIKGRLGALDAQIGAGDMDQDRLKTILDLFEEALDIESRAQKTREAGYRAFAENDSTLARSLADDLQSLNLERDEAYTTIDKALAEPPHDDQATEKPPPEEEKANLDAGLDESAEVKEPDEWVPEYEPEPMPEQAADVKAEPLDEEARHGARDATSEDEAAISDDGEDISPERIEAEVAAAIERGRFGLAYHLALVAPQVLPSANAIKLVACNYVTDESALVDADLHVLATKLKDEAEAVLNNGPDQLIQRSYAVLIAAATLSPARIAPGGPVAELLTFLEPHVDHEPLDYLPPHDEDIPPLRKLVKTAAEVSMKGIDLPVELLREDDSLEKWTEKARALHSETRNWIEKEQKAKLRFQPATRVWQRILDIWDKNGRASIGHMFEELLEESYIGIDTGRVSEIAEYWRSNREKEIDRINREIRNTASSKKIEGAGRVDLRNKIDEAITFSHRWQKLLAERPDNRPEFHTKQAKILRDAVREHAVVSIEKIDDDGAIGELAAPIARRAVELIGRYVAMFEDPATDEPALPMSLSDLLHGDLLANPKIGFGDTGQPSETPVKVDLLLDLANQDKLDFKNAAVERARRGDFLGADKAIDFAKLCRSLDDDSAGLAQDMVDAERTLVQQKFKDKVSETSNRLDAAYARGVLSQETLEQLRDKIPSIDSYSSKVFQPLFEILDQITKEIDKARQSRYKEIRQWLGKLKKASDDDRKRIETALDGDRFQVAVDFVERIERGKELPEPERVHDRPFDRFFPNFVEEYAAFRQKTTDAFAQVRLTVKNRERIGPIDAALLSEDAARDGVLLLKTWAALRDSRASDDTLKALMSALGFADVMVERESDARMIGGERVFLLKARPIADRSVTQLPDFGSHAKGRYRLLTIRGRVTEEAIIREAGKRSADRPTPNIVLFLSVLDADARRALAHAFSSDRHHPTLVLDEALVAFLAAWPGDHRQSAFFDCASAFSFAQPFDPDATEVPPEMFFGRTDERKMIVNTSGEMTHLVYGGRRLGKTALLANIAHEYRTESTERLVWLVNLKPSGIGENRPTEDLWRLFAERFAEHEIVKPQTVRHDSIKKGIKHWLGENPNRRILLLVDEADSFLKADQRSEPRYRVLEQIKALMEETERRFKIVFAGLHNVQRAARDPNTPFAHLGEPVRIGPMLPETDRDEIENLIRGPLEALGYRFDSADSVIRIAAETNYYPALAQQFCKELLRHLRENSGGHGEEGPPYIISKDTVDRVFESKETRDRICNLFSWTIQLDRRYEFLTYLIARQSFNSDHVQLRPVPIADIRDTALSEWPQGFESDSSFWMFEVLLEEMVGLGILREVDGEKDKGKGYAIRSRNLRMLLGNDDEIERRFRDAKSKQALKTFDPAQFRDDLEDETPSPLTADQGYRLLSGRNRKVVGIVFGTRLAGLDRVGEALEEAARQSARKEPRLNGAVPASLGSKLRQVSRSRKAGIDIVLIDMRNAWSPESVNEALAFVAKHDAQKRIIRPVFLCGPNEAWEWLNGPRPARKKHVELQDIWLGPCAKDFARRWLRDREAPAYACMDNQDRSVDLPWPVVLGTAARKEPPESMADAIDLTLSDDSLVSDVFVTPQTETGLRVLSNFSNDSMTADDLSDLSGDMKSKMSPEEAVLFFDWADRLGLVHKDGQGYRLDSAYAAGLETIFKE
ncbi:MAG: hypothetical protein OXB98_22085 [Bryobacterales bacterium]|nr:hypothetical protein [Bryobacterales bacterium]